MGTNTMHVATTPSPAQAHAAPRRHGRSAALRHGIALLWFLIVALLVLAPALTRGSTFGSFDLLHQFGLLHQQGVVHNTQAGDQSDSIIPWAALSWMQVHHGHLPLWNPFGALGMPLAFNWQAASFSVPTLIGYLFPLDWALTVQVVVTLVIAGSGVYALGRVLRWGTFACVFGGTVFELSGPMLGWLGWPHAAVLSWTGWLFAAALLILRGRTAIRNIAGFALVVAAMIYAGQPEILTLLGLALAVFTVVFLWRQAVGPSRRGGLPRRLLSLSAGAVAGVALGAPLLLPGLQLVARSQHSAPGGDPAELVKGNPPLPVHNLVHLLVQGFDGLPVAGNHWFGYVGGYSETAAYVGVIPVVLAVVAVALGWRRPEVSGLVAVSVASVALAFVPAVDDALNHLPLVRTIVWQRATLPLVFSLSVLAGIGMNDVVRDPLRAPVRRWLAGGFGVAALALLGLWLFGQGHLSPADARTRRMSFAWAAVEIVVGLLIVAVLTWTATYRGANRSFTTMPSTGLRRLTALVLLTCETGFLISAGGPLWSAADTPFAATGSVVAFKQTVGSSIVGYGAPLCFFPPGLGIPPNAQVAFGIQELAAYDPALPSAYFSSWKAQTGQPGGIPAISAYCPVITTVATARLYGVSFVLEREGRPGPKGALLVKRIGGEDLYRIPDSGAASLTPLGPGAGEPAWNAPSTPLAVAHPDPASWAMVTASPSGSRLRLRLTDLPGWHATVDGKAVPLTPFGGVMLQMAVPAGRHRVVLHYWPGAFTLGLALAALAILGLAVGLIAERRVDRKRGDGPVPRRSMDSGDAPYPEPEGARG